jgi:hypothetical protein
LAPDRERNIARQRNILQILGHVEIGLVEGQRFDEVSVPFEDFAHLAGDRTIAREVWGQKHRIRAKALGANRRHC